MATSRQEEKDRQLFNRIVAQYARKDVLPASALARKALLLEAMAPLLRDAQPLGTLVEVGCGIGAPALYLQGRYTEYVGVDQSEKMIAAARTFHGQNPRARFVAANIKEVDLPENSADTILLNGALHHMTELDLVMRTLQGIAKPGCRILAVEPQSANVFIQGMRRVRAWVDNSYSADQVFFSGDELTELFFRNGVSHIQVRYLGYFSPPFAQVVLRPQGLFTPLSRLACAIDRGLHKILPPFLAKASFNLAISGRFDKG